MEKNNLQTGYYRKTKQVKIFGDLHPKLLFQIIRELSNVQEVMWSPGGGIIFPVLPIPYEHTVTLALVPMTTIKFPLQPHQ